MDGAAAAATQQGTQSSNTICAVCLHVAPVDGDDGIADPPGLVPCIQTGELC